VVWQRLGWPHILYNKHLIDIIQEYNNLFNIASNSQHMLSLHLEFQVWGFEVSGSAFGVLGLGFWVESLEF